MILEKQNLKFINKSNNFDPEYSHVGDSGFDLRAWIDCEDKLDYHSDDEKPYIILMPFERRMIHTGLYFEIPEYKEIQVRPRSGASYKDGLTVINTPGTVDEPYTGELCVLAINLSNNPIYIHNGDRIAQAVLMPVYNEKLTELTKVEKILSISDRGSDGFGSTGIK